MRKLALAILALATSIAPVSAAPFDTYQLIMWQEHSPVELQGLARLGVTATKLRATGGAVDPAELAKHVASGLPWYLENIATDLYASYHRATPDKPGNWRFLDAQARHRADPADTSVFRREPSLSDAAWRDRIAQRLQTLVAAQSGERPLFYNLADEAGIADLAAAWDFDLAPASLADFRTWLQTQYPSLPALNQEWATHYERWSDIMPELTDATMRRTDANHAAWADFKAFMDIAFARAVQTGTDAIHHADPTALAGLEGGQVPGWGGYDYALLAPAVDLMEIYDSGDAVALARAANPALVVLRTSFDQNDRADAWRSLLQGGSGIIVWDEPTIVGADGAPTPRGVELAKTVAELRQIAPTLRASHPRHDPVAVLVSQASFRTTWLLARQEGGPAWADRDAEIENADNAWRAARHDTLARLRALGVEPHLVFTPGLEAGVLEQRGIKLLLLPHAIALSDAEVAAIRRFAASGGVVLADTEPGMFDGHSRRREAAPLQGVARLPNFLRIPLTAETLDAEAALLAEAGISPRATFTTAPGIRATALEARWFVAGDHDILAVQALGAKPDAVEITFPDPARIADLRAPAPASPPTDRLLIERPDPSEPVIVSVRR